MFLTFFLDKKQLNIDHIIMKVQRQRNILPSSYGQTIPNEIVGIPSAWFLSGSAIFLSLLLILIKRKRSKTDTMPPIQFFTKQEPKRFIK